MLKVFKSTCMKFWCLSAGEKSTSSLTSFSRYCKDNGNLLFWKLWKCLTISIKNYSINLQVTFILTCMRKINFINHCCLKVLKKYRKLVTLDKLGMSGHTHLKWQYQFEESFNVFLAAKSQFHSSHFQRYSKIVILGTLGKRSYAHPQWYYHLVESFFIYLEAKKPQFHLPCFSGDIGKICRLHICILWACLARHTQYNKSNLDVSLHAKNKLHYLLLPWDITF